MADLRERKFLFGEEVGELCEGALYNQRSVNNDR